MVAGAKKTPSLAREGAREIVETIPRVMGHVHAGLQHEGRSIPPAHLRALGMLAHGGATTGELADVFHVSLPSASKTLSALERQGLVLRTRDPRDRRRVRVELTEAGLSELERVRGLAVDSVAKMLEGLSPDEIATVRSALAILRAASSGTCAPRTDGDDRYEKGD